MRYFLSLASTGSVTKAAELHGISPAAFSKAIRIFRNEVGHELTLSNGRGIILTDYARSLVPSIERIIQQVDRLRGDLNSSKTGEKKLRIATFEVFSTYFLTQAIKDYFSEYRCEFHEAIPGKMEELVSLNKVDLALTYIPIPHPDLDHLKMSDIEMGLFGSPQLLKKHDFSTVPFVVPISPIEGSPNKVRGLDGWPDGAFPRNSVYQVGLLETALGLCREEMAVAYLPRFVVKMHNDLVKAGLELKELALPIKFPKTKSFVYLVKRKSDIEGTEVKRLAQGIRKLCR